MEDVSPLSLIKGIPVRGFLFLWERLIFFASAKKLEFIMIAAYISIALEKGGGSYMQ
ncbi:hypothetical protein NCCP28_01120 [Niallia sp. NCCP-28]|nr:hypothetical protein NCCP28_01120 [Niallia sp. NCCP-28]